MGTRVWGGGKGENVGKHGLWTFGKHGHPVIFGDFDAGERLHGLHWHRHHPGWSAPALCCTHGLAHLPGLRDIALHGHCHCTTPAATRCLLEPGVLPLLEASSPFACHYHTSSSCLAHSVHWLTCKLLFACSLGTALFVKVLFVFGCISG